MKERHVRPHSASPRVCDLNLALVSPIPDVGRGDQGVVSEVR